LFNILAPRIEGCVFVDAYAGTGAVGIEALSRGAQRAIFIERSRAAVEVIRQNLASLGLAARSEVFTGKVLAVLERLEADIVFLDPPYELEKEYKDALELLGTSDNPGMAIAQHAAKVELAKSYGSLHRSRVVKQGDNALSFYAL
jgi:16S rRNA (guanine(966)-N(2))-methyltransferase RsmD